MEAHAVHSQSERISRLLGGMHTVDHTCNRVQSVTSDKRNMDIKSKGVKFQGSGGSMRVAGRQWHVVLQIENTNREKTKG